MKLSVHTAHDESLPQPAPAWVSGTDAWDRFRAGDLRRRHPGVTFPTVPQPPVPRLGPAGRTWARALRQSLHRRLEDGLRLDPSTFAAMELDPAAFGAQVERLLPELAFDAGMFDLPVTDLAQIAVDPDGCEALTTLAAVWLRLRAEAPGLAGEPPLGIAHVRRVR